MHHEPAYCPDGDSKRDCTDKVLAHPVHKYWDAPYPSWQLGRGDSGQPTIVNRWGVEPLVVHQWDRHIKSATLIWYEDPSFDETGTVARGASTSLGSVNGGIEPSSLPDRALRGGHGHLDTTEAASAAVTLDERCSWATQRDTDMACRRLHATADLVAVTYDPKREAISEGAAAEVQLIGDVIERELQKRPDPKTTEWVLDIGANMGLLSLRAASLGFHVVAFEPATSNVKRLHASLFVNGLSHLVDVEQVALGSSVGVQHLFLNPDSPVFKSDGVMIPKNNTGFFDQSFYPWALSLTGKYSEGPLYQLTMTRTLDDWYEQWVRRGSARAIAAVKLDIEGYESLCVSGGRTFFAKARPQLIFMEVHTILWPIRRNEPGWMDIRSTLSLFVDDLGYRMFKLTNYHSDRDAVPLSIEAITSGDVRAGDVVFVRDVD